MLWFRSQFCFQGLALTFVVQVRRLKLKDLDGSCSKGSLKWGHIFLRSQRRGAFRRQQTLNLTLIEACSQDL